jgi:ketosteroid isomerase-like protein
MGQSGEIVKNLYAAFARGDVPVVLVAFDPKIEWREAEGFLYADGNPYVGPQAVAEGVFQRIATDLEGFKVIPGNIIDAGDTVVTEGRYQGKMRATGTFVDSQFAHVWEFRGGKVVRFRQYTDTRQWSSAAGS